MSELDSRDYTFTIISNSTNTETCKSIMKSISELGITTVSHSIHTNTITTSMQIILHEEEEGTIDEIVEQIKKIPNVIDVEGREGPRYFQRTMEDNIVLSDWLYAIVTKFRSSKVIEIVETNNNNNSQINISAGDNANITINQNNITYNIGGNPFSQNPPDNIINKIESLKQVIQNDEQLEKKDKENAIKVSERIKQYYSKSASLVEQHKELIKWFVPNSSYAVNIVIAILMMLQR